VITPKENEPRPSPMSKQEKDRAKESENTRKRIRVILKRRNSFLFESMEASNFTH